MNWIIGIVLLVALASGAAALEADAGDDQHVSRDTLVTLDGSGSTGALTYNRTEDGIVLSDQISFSHNFSVGTHTITLTILQMVMKNSGAVPEIVINELIPNPIGVDRGNESTELYNCGDEPVDIGGWVLENEDGGSYTIPEGTAIEPHGYYLTTKVQLDNGGGYVLLYHNGEEVDGSIAYTHSTEGISWQRRTDGLDTDSDGDWIERDSTFGVPG